MLRLIKHSFTCLLLVLAVRSASGFSMTGPILDWQTEELSYRSATLVPFGGPRNLGEEYRWNLPRVYYAFDESFLNYFGSNGVVAVEAAFKILNDLPPVSSMSANLSEYPLNTTRLNYRASALYLLDVKSTILRIMMEEMGLVSPERFVWTLRAHYHYPNDGPLEWMVIQRNFDPVTWEPSSYVNGTLYTYTIFHSQDPHVTDAVESSVDPTAVVGTSVAYQGVMAGSYYTGLTRDDVGGLRYMLRSSNVNAENLPSNTTGNSTGNGSNSFPWVPIGITNQMGTNLITTNLTNYVITAWRPGVEKVTFVRLTNDFTFGQRPITNTWTETIYTNRYTAPIKQVLQRIVAAPDITISAADLGTADGVPFIMEYNFADGWTNNSAINGAATLDGPGVIPTPIVITFNKVGPSLINQTPNSLGEAGALRYYFWGSFDGSTNAPIVYPNGTSIRNFESIVLGR